MPAGRPKENVPKKGPKRMTFLKPTYIYTASCPACKAEVEGWSRRVGAGDSLTFKCSCGCRFLVYDCKGHLKRREMQEEKQVATPSRICRDGCEFHAKAEASSCYCTNVEAIKVKWHFDCCEAKEIETPVICPFFKPKGGTSICTQR